MRDEEFKEGIRRLTEGGEEPTNVVQKLNSACLVQCGRTNPGSTSYPINLPLIVRQDTGNNLDYGTHINH